MKVTIQAQNWFLYYLIDPIFLGVNRLFVLSFSDGIKRTGNRRYFIPNVQVGDYKVMIDGQNLFYQTIKSDKRTYDSIWKIATGQGDDYKSACLIDYPYFRYHYKMITIDLSKQQVLDADPKVKQQINFPGNLNRRKVATIFFIIEEARETVLDFSNEIVEVLYFMLIKHFKCKIV